MDKEAIKIALDKASSMYPYEVVGKPENIFSIQCWLAGRDRLFVSAFGY